MNTEKHTALPWILEKPSSYNQIGDRLIIRSEDTSRNRWDQICEVGIIHTGLMGGTPKYNAELIVRAVNNHHKLVEALEGSVKIMKSLVKHQRIVNLDEAIAYYQSVIQSAKEEPKQ